MRPPLCAVCERDVKSQDGLVRFVSRATDLDWRERARQPGFVGHPPDTDWFCAVHLSPARALAEAHTIDAALATLRAAEGADEG